MPSIRNFPKISFPCYFHIKGFYLKSLLFNFLVLQSIFEAFVNPKTGLNLRIAFITTALRQGRAIGI
jgi:hypothetical protein